MLENLLTWLGKCPKVEGFSDLACLEDAFRRLPERGRFEVSQEFLEAIAALNVPSVWAVGSLVYGQPLGDDYFKDFRRWLVLQGREITTTALNAPDQLLRGLRPYAGNPQIFVEAVDWLEESASQSVRQTQAHGSNWITPDLDEMKALVPLTFEAFGEGYRAASADVECSDRLSIDGLGDLKVGDRVRHRGQFGLGVIRAVRVAETGIADIEFLSGLRTMRVLVSFFERADDSP